MKFSDWLPLREAEEQQVTEPPKAQPQPTEPDARQIAYIACVLHRHSQAELLNTVDRWTTSNIPRQGWIGVAHHMTVVPPGKFKQADLANMPWGKEVDLTVTDWAYDENGIAVVVRPSMNLPFADSQVPHITVAHSYMVKPKYSNDLLANHENWDHARSQITLKSYFVGVMQGNPTVVYPPMGSLLLASPTIGLGSG